MLKWTNPTKVGYDYYFRFTNREYDRMSPLSAAEHTIKYITENYPAPYTLCLSGGVDSQAMLYAWHVSGVPFRTFSAVYNQTLNLHDLSTLQEFTNKIGVSVEYCDFDLVKFLEEEHDWYANKYYCGSPQITTFMKFADLIPDGTVLMSGQFIFADRAQLSLGLPDRNNFSLYEYGIESGRSIVPFFFLETAELAYAFDVDIDEVKSMHTPGSYTDKVVAYQHYGFPVIGQSLKLISNTLS